MFQEFKRRGRSWGTGRGENVECGVGNPRTWSEELILELSRNARRMLGDLQVSDRDDVVQEMLCNLQRSGDRVARMTRPSLFAYAARVAQNAAKAIRRPGGTRARIVFRRLPDELAEPDRRESLEEIRGRFRKRLSLLPDDLTESQVELLQCLLDGEPSVTELLEIRGIELWKLKKLASVLRERLGCECQDA